MRVLTAGLLRRRSRPAAGLATVALVGSLFFGAAGSPVTAAAATAAATSAAAEPAGAATPARAAGPATVPLPSQLSAAQLAGQRAIYSYTGLTPPASLLQAISAGEAAGVIFSSDNIASPAQLATVARQLQQAAFRSPIKLPLLLMTDQEGGLVRRLPGAPVLSEKQIGESPDPAALAQQEGLASGINLLGAGLNVDLAPVLGVYRQAGDFLDQDQRSYSMNPAVVASAGSAFVQGLQTTRVAATAKHFPGLGAAAANQDTDLGPVTLNVPLAELRSIDEAPYPSAIAAGVQLVMVSWAIYPALDPTRPAGLSPTVVQGELRDRLGFRGVTITDALGAGALAAYGSLGQRAELAAAAGMDLLLYSGGDISDELAGGAAVQAAVQNGTLPLAPFQASVGRVLALRQSLEASTVGWYRPVDGSYHLLSRNATGAPDLAFAGGPAGDPSIIPLEGDWTGDGVRTVGWYRPSDGSFHLLLSNAPGAPDIAFVGAPAGQPDIVPVVGDWTGSGVDTVGWYRPTDGSFHLLLSNAAGAPDIAFVSGPAGATNVVPVAGDWTGSGVDTVGWYSPTDGSFHLYLANAYGSRDIAFVGAPANASDVEPVTGDWFGTGIDTAGWYRQTDGSFHLLDNNAYGSVDLAFVGAPAEDPSVRPVVAP